MNPLELRTANGAVHVTEDVGNQVMGLMDNSRALVLESTPAVLSIGLRCMEHGWSYHWRAGKAPVMRSPSGVETVVAVYSNVPFLMEGSPAYPAGAPVQDSFRLVLVGRSAARSWATSRG